MNIGLLTLQSNWNYGNRLQNYALNQVLTEYGCRVTNLRLRQLHDTKQAMKMSAKRMLLKVGVWDFATFEKRATMSERMTKAHRENFISFNDDMTIESVGYQASRKELDRFDALVVGSDQIWNPNLTSKELGWYLLSSSPKAVRVAYSASFGTESLPAHMNDLYRNGLKGFDSLSVREESGASIVNKLTGEHPSVTLDPTMLIDSNDWIRVSNNRFVPDHPYIFVYFLGDISLEQKRYIEHFVNDGFDIVSLGGFTSISVPAGPQDFIALVANASHVVTNSFHGAVFAALFQIPLTVLQRIENPSMRGRIDTLCSTFGLVNNINREDGYAENMDYSMFNSVLDQKRAFSLNWIKNNIVCRLSK